MRYQEEIEGGICTSCGEECEGTISDEGIGAYEYWGFCGTHHDYVRVSSCCGSEIAEDGGVVVDATSYHKARKDLVEDGKVVVRAGRRYRKRYTRTWFIDTDGSRKGNVSIWKREVA